MERIAQSINRLLLLAVVLAVGCGGCDSVSPPDAQPPAEDVGRPVDQTVTVAFRNTSVADTVDVQFYAAAVAAEGLPDALFQPENRIIAHVGIAGTGLILPGATDSVEVDCVPGLVIGTAGGRFLDSDSGEVTGESDPRILQVDFLGVCGAVVGLSFNSGDGTFTTKLEIR